MHCDCFTVDGGLVCDLCLSAAIFPDDDMARSDSWIKEESVRIQAKCLMETLVNICVRKFVLVCVFFV